MLKICSLSLVGLVSVLALLAATPEGPQKPKPYAPKVAAASDEGQKALARMRLPVGMKGTLWAAEPLLANPVSFCFDEKGRCYVAETFRLNAGVTDNRGHMNWLDEELACRTVEDRVEMFKKYEKENFKTYLTEHERVRLIEDSTGKGVADKATVFADGFNNAADGVGAGLLAHDGTVYFTCIPDLWMLKDTTGKGQADIRSSVGTGFGVHVAFIGHDMHGLTIGPDGRLYFSIGDRGLNVTTREKKHLYFPDGGAVLRCELDGSNLEIYAVGLRNPQELAFDQFGNLFTGDNNSDSGDRARVVNVLEGGDTGWRIGYQYGSSISDRGPFNAEKIWHLPNPDQPAHINPPIAHLGDGPSGLTFNPGATLLPAGYENHFFLCDFRGGAGNSGIRSFAVKPKGTSFELVDSKQFIWSALPTDCDFAPDGALYLCDWVDGWGMTGKGRVYRFTDPASPTTKQAAEVKTLLGEGFKQRAVNDLVGLLTHIDRRVRQGAQLALAGKGAEAVGPLVDLANGKGEILKNIPAELAQLGRIHAIWCLGQMGRKNSELLGPVVALLADPDTEIRSQSARVLGDAPLAAAQPALVGLLKDAEPRVRYFAAQALGHYKVPDQAKPLFALLRENADREPNLRLAAVMGLAGSATTADLVAAADDPSPSVRVGALLALRRRHDPAISRFLEDSDPRVVLETARAIHDEPIEESLPRLAALISRTGLPELAQFRILNANFRLGTPAHAEALAAFAGRPGGTEKARAEAVQMLGDWATPGRRDRVTGLTQKLPARDATIAASALRHQLAGIFTGPDGVRREAAKVAGKLGIKEVGPALRELVTNASLPARTRIESLSALAAIKDPELEKLMTAALTDKEPRMRSQGLRHLAGTKPAEAMPLLSAVLEKGELTEKQAAFATLGKMKGEESAKLLAQQADLLLGGQLAPEAQLDLLEALNQRSEGLLKDKRSQYDRKRDANNPLSAWQESLVGGDAEAGRNLFHFKSELSCLRCHKVDGNGGEVGPDLSGIGSKQKRDYLLESIVIPNKQIAKGYETVILTLNNGKTITGVLRQETPTELQLITPEGQQLKIARADIEERTQGKSAMPDDLIKHLSKQEMRDLVEYLASLKQPTAPAPR